MRTSENTGRHRRSGRGDHGDAFEHTVLLHDGSERMVAGVLAHVRAGLEADDVVVVALPRAALSPVREALGDDAAHVVLQDLDRLARNPARLVPTMLSFAAAHERRRVRAVGQPFWAGRSAAELGACLQHDALCNVAFADLPISLLCPYDTSVLDDETIADVRAAHPQVVEDDVVVPNPTYGDPVKLAEAVAGPLEEAPELGETLVYGAPDGPRSVRRAVAGHAVRAGLSSERIDDLCLAVHEVAVNTVVHTDAPGILSLWQEDGWVVAEIQDAGHIDDPLVGRHPPVPGDGRGYGLFLTHRLCDLVRIHSTRDTGTTVRMSMRIDG